MSIEYVRGGETLSREVHNHATKEAEAWPQLGTDNFVRLMILRHNAVMSADGEIDLMPAKPYEWNIKLYEEVFRDPIVTKHLTISPDFSAEDYITGINGPIGRPSGSPEKALYHIYKRGYYQGPVGHVSIKEIDWENLTFHRGIVLKRDFMGQGIGPKAGFLVLEHMQKLGFKCAYTEVKAGNTLSINAAKKQFGEGVLKDDGQFHFELDLTNPLTFNPFQRENH